MNSNTNNTTVDDPVQTSTALSSTSTTEQPPVPSSLTNNSKTKLLNQKQNSDLGLKSSFNKAKKSSFLSYAKIRSKTCASVTQNTNPPLPQASLSAQALFLNQKRLLIMSQELFIAQRFYFIENFNLLIFCFKVSSISTNNF